MTVAAPGRGPRRLLVVEDDAHLRRGLALILGAEGYEVEVAADGEEGLACALAGGIDCILTDTMMPRVDGLEMLRRLGERGVAVPPVLLVSAAYALPPRAQLEALGVREVLPKPYAIGALLDAVRRVLGII